MQAMLTIAVRAARQAGDYLARKLETADYLQVERKGRSDFACEADHRAERMILSTLRAAYPDHAILAEESGARGNHHYCWVIDPLDGTTNFLHRCPHIAVSIALKLKQQIIHAVVYDPLQGEMFTASRGHGAYLNDSRIRVSRCTAMRGALFGTGFPSQSPRYLAEHAAGLQRILEQAAGVRCLGTAALNLAYVACGRLDGFWELDLKPWDVAAGGLLVEEAGGLVSDAQGGDQHLPSGYLLAASPRVHRQALPLLVPARSS